MVLNQLLRSGKRKRINLNGEDRKVIRKFAFLPKIVNGKFVWLKNYYIVFTPKQMIINGYPCTINIEEYYNSYEEVNLLNR